MSTENLIKKSTRAYSLAIEQVWNRLIELLTEYMYGPKVAVNCDLRTKCRLAQGANLSNHSFRDESFSPGSIIPCRNRAISDKIT